MEELWKDKRRSDDNGRGERGPGLYYFVFCVQQSTALLLCSFILLLKSLNVRRFPPPSRSTNCVATGFYCSQKWQRVK